MPAQPMGGEGSVAGKGTHPKFHLREGDSCTLARERVCLMAPTPHPAFQQTLHKDLTLQTMIKIVNL